MNKHFDSKLLNSDWCMAPHTSKHQERAQIKQTKDRNVSCETALTVPILASVLVGPIAQTKKLIEKKCFQGLYHGLAQGSAFTLPRLTCSFSFLCYLFPPGGWLNPPCSSSLCSGCTTQYLPSCLRTPVWQPDCTSSWGSDPFRYKTTAREPNNSLDLKPHWDRSQKATKDELFTAGCSFSWQTFWLVTVGKAQLSIITLMMDLFWSLSQTWHH